MPVSRAARRFGSGNAIRDKSEFAEAQGKIEGMIQDDHTAIFGKGRKREKEDGEKKSESRRRQAPNDAQQKKPESFEKPLRFSHFSSPERSRDSPRRVPFYSITPRPIIQAKTRPVSLGKIDAGLTNPTNYCMLNP